MNIDFERDNYKFNVRASAIILNEKKDKILLFKVEDGRDYFYYQVEELNCLRIV